MSRIALLSSVSASVAAGAIAILADVVPTEVRMPGTQPGEASLESLNKCDNCHGGYDPAVEPVRNWSGSMMAQAGRDPLFWATMAIAEQDFDGVGDLCLRCHAPEGWIAGRSTPTDGSGLASSDGDGVSCDLCHQLTNPDDSEHLGVQIAPFIANTGGSNPTAFLGSGMYVLYAGAAKLGPYSDPDARHQALPSAFHRESALCGTCHDVSNPVVGDLAPSNGAPAPLAPGTFSGVLGAAVETKAAFLNEPFRYGVVERTYSEHVASAFDTLRVQDATTLPVELMDGAILAAYDAAMAATPDGDYVDGSPRTFTCQTCHMPPVTGAGCNKPNVQVRRDLPLHDMTGANTWVPSAIAYLDARDDLVLGGGMSASEVAAMSEGAERARTTLQRAAKLELDGDTVRVVNLTGHKLPTGYPEGRRMWLRVRWKDAGGSVLREDGAYGPMTVDLDGDPVVVQSILDLDDPRLTIYEAHMGMSSAWATDLLGLGYDPALPLAFDRTTGDVTLTLAEAASAGAPSETFHFALNDTVVADHRVPPYGMSYDAAIERNCAPVPSDAYGAPGPGGTYAYWDEVALEPPLGAFEATIELLYQTTSWEYVQFLYLANDGSVAFLAEEGDNLLDAWLATGMANPEVIDTVQWRAGVGPRKVNGPPRPVSGTGVRLP